MAHHLKQITKGCFMSTLVEIRPVVLERKIFKCHQITVFLLLRLLRCCLF